MDMIRGVLYKEKGCPVDLTVQFISSAKSIQVDESLSLSALIQVLQRVGINQLGPWDNK